MESHWLVNFPLASPCHTLSCDCIRIRGTHDAIVRRSVDKSVDSLANNEKARRIRSADSSLALLEQSSAKTSRASFNRRVLIVVLLLNPKYNL